jgi:outer membrane protein OmpA-like peptidoglycan-associated protein
MLSTPSVRVEVIFLLRWRRMKRSIQTISFVAGCGAFLAGCSEIPHKELVKTPIPIYIGGQRVPVLDREGREMATYLSKGESVVAVTEVTPEPAVEVPVVTPEAFEATHQFDFSFDSSELSPEQQSQLEAIVPVLEKTGNPVIVEGYTDAIGPAAYNYQLGLRRAGAVKDYLVAKGVASSRIETKSYGETREPDRKALIKPVETLQGE